MTTNTNAALREFAEGRIHHLNRGQCPDIVAGHDSRDPDCPVCAALTTAAAVPAASRHSEYPPLPEPDATTVGLGAVWNRHSMRAYVDAARALLAQAAPAAVAGPSDSEIDALVASIGPTEGIRRDSRDLTMDKLRVLVRRALATWGNDKAILRQKDQKPYAYAVYFPDQPTVELVHDLDELTDDLTNRAHQITKLYAAPQAEPAAQGDAEDAAPSQKEGL